MELRHQGTAFSRPMLHHLVCLSIGAFFLITSGGIVTEAWISPILPTTTTTTTRTTSKPSSTREFFNSNPRRHPLIVLSSSYHSSSEEGWKNANVTATIEKKVRRAEAQAKIDRILSDPIDPPFDMETELKKVVSISPPLVEFNNGKLESIKFKSSSKSLKTTNSSNSSSSSIEDTLDERTSQLEQELYQAVKDQDFSLAHQRKQELSKLQVDDCGAILQLNSAFYKAFSKKDIEEMERIWLKDNAAVCIHPSLPPLVGCRDILDSWKRMFEATEGSFQKTWMKPNEIRLSVKGSTGIITCEEHVYTRRFIRGKPRETELVNKLMATNVFRKVGGRWFLTYHHASWHADSENAKLALGKGDSKSKSDGKNRIVFRGRLRSSDDDEYGDDGDDSSPSSIESILGLQSFGPLLGDSGKVDGEKPFKKVIMGPLSDLLSSGLLGGGGSIDGSNAGKNQNGDGLNGAIIQFSRIDNDGEEEDDDIISLNDDDYDDDDDDADDPEDEKLQALEQFFKPQTSSPSSSSTPKSLSDNGKEQKESSSSFTPSSSSSGSSSQKSSAPANDSLRQKCISALRKLANQGCISSKQKRVLLTDIISCSAKGEFSMVEVAYDLLCSEGEEDCDIAEEEFADQCRVFAHEFLHSEPSVSSPPLPPPQ